VVLKVSEQGGTERGVEHVVHIHRHKFSDCAFADQVGDFVEERRLGLERIRDVEALLVGGPCLEGLEGRLDAWEEHLFAEDHDLLVSFEDEVDESVVVAVFFSDKDKRDAGIIEDILMVCRELHIASKICGDLLEERGAGRADATELGRVFFRGLEDLDDLETAFVETHDRVKRDGDSGLVCVIGVALHSLLEISVSIHDLRWSFGVLLDLRFELVIECWWECKDDRGHDVVAEITRGRVVHLER